MLCSSMDAVRVLSGQQLRVKITWVNSGHRHNNQSLALIKIEAVANRCIQSFFTTTFEFYVSIRSTIQIPVSDRN